MEGELLYEFSEHDSYLDIYDDNGPQVEMKTVAVDTADLEEEDEEEIFSDPSILESILRGGGEISSAGSKKKPVLHKGQTRDKELKNMMYAPATKKEKKGYCANMSAYDKIFRVVLGLNIIWMCVHIIFFAGIGFILSMKSGQLFTEYFFYDYNERYLSPLIPIWNDIGETLPFGNYFLFTIIMCFVVAAFNVYLASLTIVLNCLKQQRHLNFSILLIFSFLIYIVFLMIEVIYPDLFLNALFDKKRGELHMKNMIGLYYQIISNDEFTNALNMLMVMGSCCGIQGPHNFEGPYKLDINPNLNRYETGTKVRIKKLPKWPDRAWKSDDIDNPVNIPPACCKRGRRFSNPKAEFELLLKCAKGDNPELYYQEGCEQTYMRLFRKRYMPTIRSVCLASAICMTILLVWIIIRVYRRWRNINIRKSLHVGKEDNDEELMAEVHYWYYPTETKPEEG